MLSSTLPPPGLSGRTPAAPVRHVAPAALSLPVFSPAIPHTVTFRDGGNSAALFAGRLANAGVLKRPHWNGDILASCETAMKDFTAAARPNPLAWTALAIHDAIEVRSYDTRHGYLAKYMLKAMPPKVSAFALQVDGAEQITHMNIGPTLRYLESYRRGLGQTVLSVLDAGLSSCCRGLTPRNGVDWASNAYWCGESNEDYRVEEDLLHAIDGYEYEKKQLPKNATAAEIEKKLGKPPTVESLEIFRRKDFEKAIPGWAGGGKITPWSVRQLTRYQPRERKVRNIIGATVALAQARKPKTWHDLNDFACFEGYNWDVVPFILRWNGYADPLGQIYDDVVNPDYEAGDCDMSVNAIFCFHDDPSLARALRHLHRYLELMQLCENLIRLIGEKL